MSEHPTAIKTKKQVLVVDDEPELADLYADFLRDEGFNVTLASSGAEALKLIERTRFDAIISDQQMPGMNGLELIEKTRNSILNKETAVVLISGEIDTNITKTAANLNVQQIYAKPVSLSELIDRLKLMVA